MALIIFTVRARRKQTICPVKNHPKHTNPHHVYRALPTYLCPLFPFFVCHASSFGGSIGIQWVTVSGATLEINHLSPSHLSQ
jgi:hypothetical protein